jgi:Tfp pilus assembly protein PilX
MQQMPRKYWSNLHSASRVHKNGFVMITVLIFMVILMIVAIAAMRSTKSEVAIAGARYFRSQAFQQSQSTLILAERCISTPADCTLASVPAFDGSKPGWLSKASNNLRSGFKSWTTDISWAGTTAGIYNPVTDPIIGVDVARQPQYTVEKFAKQSLDDSSDCSDCPSAVLSYMQPFRLTARSTSPNDGSTVLLQRHIWTLAE